MESVRTTFTETVCPSNGVSLSCPSSRRLEGGVGNGTEDTWMQVNLGGSTMHSKTGVTYDLRQEQANMDDLHTE